MSKVLLFQSGMAVLQDHTVKTRLGQNIESSRSRHTEQRTKWIFFKEATLLTEVIPEVHLTTQGSHFDDRLPQEIV